MREQVRQWIADQERRAGEREGLTIDPELAEELRALGYL